MTDRCQCTNCDHLLVEKFKQQRDESLKRIEDFKRHVIPCVICEYKDGVLEKKCWLHEKLEEEKRWKEAYHQAFIEHFRSDCLMRKAEEEVEDRARRIFEEEK